ncbi:hypothetical protein FRC01_003962, partial [Tulasnella sp. 417]
MERDFSAFYIVSPWMRNGNIQDYLGRTKLESDARLKLLRDVVKGLQYLHSPTVSMVHGNVNPQTVLINDKGKAVLSDVTVDYRLMRRRFLSSDGAESVWSSPEVIEDGSITSKADIWSWACVALSAMLPLLLAPFLASLATATPLPPPSSHQWTTSTDSTYDVLILGGGVAGVIAAQQLHEAGINNFLIVEARDELGGRMHSYKLGNHTVEVGCNWVQGTRTGNGPINPMYNLALKHKL